MQSSARPKPQMPSACASGGCGGGQQPARVLAPSFSVVKVNGVEIEPEMIAQEMQNHPAPNGETSWQEAARALAVRELLIQEARRCGIGSDPEADESGRVETEDDALIRQLLQDSVTMPSPPCEEECRRYYDAQSLRFRTPDLFEVSHILIEPESDDAQGWAAARSQACVIVKEIGDDPQAFARAAEAFSKCPSARQGGSLGQVRRGELVPAIQTAFEALPVGTTSPEPVRSRFGWHALHLARRIDGRVLPFDVVHSKIADMLEARSWAIASARYIAGLTELAAIEGVDISPSDAANPGSSSC